MNLIERAKNIILTPASEWEVINNESTTTAQLYTSYILLLAAIGPLAMILGGGFFSMLYRVPLAIMTYVLSLVSVFAVGFIIDLLAPNFGAQKNQMQALKVSAYAMTPAWIAGIFNLIPFLGMLGLLASLYGLYLLYLGLPVLMKVAQDKVVPYVVVVVVCAFVTIGIFGWIATFTSGLMIWSGAMHSSANAGFETARQLAAINAASKTVNIPAPPAVPQQPVNPAAAMNAAATAIQGNGPAVEPVDQALLKAMLPDSAGSLKRNKLEAEKAGMANFKISKAEAGYGDGQGHSIDVTVTDAGGVTSFAALAAWSMIESEQETDNGYEKMGKVDGRPVHEKYNKQSKDGEYSVIVANRFIVDAQGHQVDMDALKQAVAAIGMNKLEALKNSGVKQ